MRILFDQGTPVPIRKALKAHDVRTTAQEGWANLKNGELLSLAEAAGFDVFLTTDKNIGYQQNLAGRKIAIAVICQQQWPNLRPYVQRIADAINEITSGAYIEIDIPAP